MIEVKEINYIIDTRDYVLPSEITLTIVKIVDPEITVTQEAHSHDRTTTDTEVVIDKIGLEISLDPQMEFQSIEDPE